MAMNPTSSSSSTTSNISIALQQAESQPMRDRKTKLSKSEKEKLQTLDQETQAAIKKLKISKQELLLSHDGLFALQEKLIMPEDAKKIVYRVLDFLLTSYGRLILQKHTINLALLGTLSDAVRKSRKTFYRTAEEQSLAGIKDYLEFAINTGISPEIQRIHLIPMDEEDSLEEEDSWEEEDLDESASKKSYHISIGQLLETSNVFSKNCVTILAYVLHAFADALDKHKITRWPDGLSALDLARLLLPYQQDIINFFNPQQVLNLGDKLTPLMTCYGMQALKENLITTEQAMQISREPLEILMSDCGLRALRLHLITPEEASSKPTAELRKLITDDGLTTLRANKASTSSSSSALSFGR